MKLERGQLTSLILLALALFTAIAVILTRDRPTTSERAERANNLLPVFREDDLERVSLEAPGQSWLLERGSAGDFTLKAPEPEPADAAAAERLIAALGFAAPERRLPATNRETLGLAEPVARLGLEMGALRYRLSLGKEAPAPAGARYVAVEGDGVDPFFAVVDAEVAALFRTTADDLRERALFAIAASELGELVIERPEGTLRLTRSGGHGFRIDGKLRASREALEPLFIALARLEATHFLPLAEAERRRAEPPRWIVRAVPRDPAKKPFTIELGGPCPDAPGELFAVVKSPRPRAACLKSGATAALGVTGAGLVDRTPFAARADEVERLRIERGSKKLVLERSSSGFRLREPSEADVELETGNERLARIVRAEAEIPAEPKLAALGLSPAQGRAIITTLGDDDQTHEEILELGHRQPDGSLPAKRLEDGAVLVIGPEAAHAFAADATLLKSRELLSFGRSSLAELVLSEPERQVLRRAGDGFELTVPEGFSHDGELALDAVLALGSLRALSFVADADDGSFGLEKPELTARARFDADGGSAEIELLVGRATPGGHYARLTREPSVFVVERAVVARLSTLLIDRSVMVCDPKTLARVVIRRGETSHVLERRHGALGPVPGSPLAPAVADRLVEALAGLRPEAGLHTGNPRPEEGFGSPELEIELVPQPGAGAARTFRFGASTLHRGEGARYARSSSSPATFSMAEAKLRPFFELF